MAGIDELSIHIAADANKAEKALDNLISRLQTLDRSLNLGNLAKFTAQLKEISVASSGLKTVGADIRSIANAGSSLSKLTGFKTLNDEIRETEAQAKKLATSMADSLNFDSSRSKGYREAVKIFTETINDQFSLLRGGKKEAAFDGIYSSVIKELERAKPQFEETYKAVKEFAQSTKLIVDEKTLSDLSRLHDGLSEVKNSIKGFSTNGQENVANYFKELAEVTGVHFDTSNFTNAIEELIEYLNNGVQRIDQTAGLTAEQIEEDFKMRGAQLAQAVRDFYAQTTTTENVKNPFEGIAVGLKSLEGITLPDFSGLSALADGINRLKDVKAGQLEKIADVLRTMGNVTINAPTDGISRITQETEKAAQSAGSNIKGAFSDLEHILSADDKALGAFFARMNDLKKLISGMKNEKVSPDADAYRAAEQELAILNEQYKRHQQELRNMAKAAVESFGEVRNQAKEVSGFLSGEERIRVDVDVEDANAHLKELYRELAEVSDAVRSFQSGKSEITGDEYLVVKERLAEINAEIKHIETANTDGVAKNIEAIGEAASGASAKLSELDQYVQRIFSTGWKQDGFSQSIADALRNISDFNSELSRMKQRPEIFDARMFEQFSAEVEKNTRKWQSFERTISRRIRLGGGFDEASQEAQKLRDRMEDINRLRSEMESGKIGIDAGQFRAWGDELDKLSKRYDELMGKKKKAEEPTRIDLLANLVALGHEIGNISKAFDNLANKGITALKWMYKPVVAVANEYKEKLSSIGDFFKSFADRAQKSLAKLSAFWKRSMKTFTFMLVRKAITAVINEINDATESLAKWSKLFGTTFNDSMSQITSNLSYMARAIVGAFEPLINAVVPIINALSDAVASAAARIGEFFAALTGQGYYMQAVRQVTDYADSVDKANKAQKNLIAGLDDLNIITTPTSTASGMDEVADQWKKMDVSDTTKDWADKVKDVAKRLFEPIKNAWDEAGDHVKSGFKFMVGELAQLGKSIGRDMLKVWEEEATQKIFEDILHAIGYIEEGIGWIAKRFREAWDEADRGLHILQNIRDIIKIAADHIRNMAEYFKEWAKNLNFKPLLDVVESLTKAIQPLIDFIFGLIEDWFERVTLRHIKWLIEEGLPHIGATIERILAAFDFEDLRKKLQPLMDAFETMRENIETGIVNAIGNLGERIGQFTQSEEFASFLENVAWFMNQITAERVEKLFTALGDAVLDIAEALMKFVGSENFKDFMQRIFNWYDSLSTEDIAGFIKGIAIAIGLFKFTAFAGDKLSGFFRFVSVLQSWKNIKKLTSEVKDLGKGLETVGKGAEVAGKGGGFLTTLTDGLGKLVKGAGGIASVLGGMTLAVSGFVNMWKGGWNIAGEVVKDLGIALVAVGAVLLGVVTGPVAAAVAGITAAATTIVILVKDNWETVKEAFGKAIEWIVEKVKGFVEGVFNFFKWLKYVLIGDPIVFDLVNGVIGAFVGMVTGVLEAVGGFVEKVVGVFVSIKGAVVEKFNDLKDAAVKKWGEIKDGVFEIAENLRSDLEEKWEEAKKNAVEKFTQLKDDAVELFTTIRDKVIEKAREMKEKVVSRVNEMKTNALSKITELKTEAVNRFNALKDEAVAKFNELKDNAIGAVNNLKTGAESLFNNMKTTVVGIAGSIAEDVSHKFWDMVGWARDAFQSVVDSAGSILSGVKGAVQGAFSDASTWLSNAGGYIVQGLSNGITGAKNYVTQAFDKVTGWGSQRFTSSAYGWGIHSPSTLTEEWGEYIDLGLYNGIVDNAYKVTDSMQNLAVNSQQAFLNNQGDFNAIASEQMAQFSQGIMAQMNRVSDAMKNMGSGALATFQHAFSGIQSVGENVIGGLIEGLNRKAAALWDVMRDMAQRMMKTFTGILDIHSPSGVFKDFGEYVVEGFNSGIKNLASSTDKVVGSWLKNATEFSVPQYDFSQAIPKPNLPTDIHSYGSLSGMLDVDNSAIQDGVRAGVSEVVGGLLLPYLRDIAESSRETAGKNFTIGTDAVGRAAQRYARDYQNRTGKPAYGY